MSLLFQIQEFFTEALWSKLPESWQEALAVVDLSEVAGLLLGHDMDAHDKYTTHTISLNSYYIDYSQSHNEPLDGTRMVTRARTHTVSPCLKYTPSLYWLSLLLPTHSHCHGNLHHPTDLFHE